MCAREAPLYWRSSTEAQPGFDKSSDLLVNIVFSNNKGQRLFGVPTDVLPTAPVTLARRGRFVCTIPCLPLLPGNYELDIACLVNRELTDKVMGAASITVVEGDFHGTGRLPINYYGDLLTRYHWTFTADGAGVAAARGDVPLSMEKSG